MNGKSEKRTLGMSVLMSAPGPVILALALTKGRSSTQIADFVRRSAELLALAVTYGTYLLTQRQPDPVKNARYERRANLVTGSMMLLGGGIMLALAVLSSGEAQGNVVPSLAIALLGVIANTLFWRKYARLNRKNSNAMILVQSRLYRAKSLVDGCVVAALISVFLLPGSAVSYWLDRIGSGIVALYLCWCGIRTIGENNG